MSSSNPPETPRPRLAITVCTVPEAAAGPFVLHGPLENSFRLAALAGFDGVELFLPGPGNASEISRLAHDHGLTIAAVGTGAGRVCHHWSLTSPDPSTRQAALNFARSMIRFGGELGVPAILGSMQGRASDGLPRHEALSRLAEGLAELADSADLARFPLLYEPLNRYETDLFNRLEDASAFLETNALDRVMLLADLFHMAIEEAAPAAALRQHGKRIGHVHWADSNRRAMGLGHSPAAELAAALRDIAYTGWLSAEVFPLPDANQAAAATLSSYRNCFP